jgi:RNA polymerase sigma-70 factor (ECF subfamily)
MVPANVTNFSTGRVYVDHDADDLAIVARCRGGETAAFEALVERYQRVLFTVALRMLGDYDAASDAAQNAFVKAYQKLETFDRTRRFFSWIYRILVNECLNARRDQPSHEPLAPDLPPPTLQPISSETAERRRRCSRPSCAAAGISRGHRAEALHELSCEEIGETLHLPAKTVKSRLHTARARLAGMLRGLEARA